MSNLSRRRANQQNPARTVSGPSDALLYLRIVCFATLVPNLLRLRLSTVDRLLTPRRRHALAEPSRLAKIAAMTDSVSSLRFVRRSCLVRGTTLYYFLTRAGLDVSLSFGIGQVDGAFAGHCWLVRDGEPYLEKQDPRPTFVVVYSIPHDASAPAPIASVHRMSR